MNFCILFFVCYLFNSTCYLISFISAFFTVEAKIRKTMYINSGLFQLNGNFTSVNSMGFDLISNWEREPKYWLFVVADYSTEWLLLHSHDFLRDIYNLVRPTRCNAESRPLAKNSQVHVHACVSHWIQWSFPSRSNGLWKYQNLSKNDKWHQISWQAVVRLSLTVRHALILHLRWVTIDSRGRSTLPIKIVALPVFRASFSIHVFNQQPRIAIELSHAHQHHLWSSARQQWNLFLCSLFLIYIFIFIILVEEQKADRVRTDIHIISHRKTCVNTVRSNCFSHFIVCGVNLFWFSRFTCAILSA